MMRLTSAIGLAFLTDRMADPINFYEPMRLPPHKKKTGALKLRRANRKRRNRKRVAA